MRGSRSARTGSRRCPTPACDGETVPAHHLARTVQVPENPSQSWHATHLQWADGKLDGFVSATQKLVPGADPAVPMGYWTEADLPFYYGLARTFPLADRWFSLLPGPDLPEPPVPDLRDRQRADRRPAGEPGRLPGRRAPSSTS